MVFKTAAGRPELWQWKNRVQYYLPKYGESDLKL